MSAPDVCVAGGGLIGLACALELQTAGMQVTVLERDRADGGAAWAAAGMLAVDDTANPAALRAFSEWSRALYPQFLERIAELGGERVAVETEWVLELSGAGELAAALPAGLRGEGWRLAAEWSVDPRKLVTALLQAARAAGVEVREGAAVERVRGRCPRGVRVDTTQGPVDAGSYLDCTGAWCPVHVRPAKGQMLRVHAPGALAVPGHGNVAVRTEDIYLLPRVNGSVLIGATIEDAGFDVATSDGDIAALRARAANLMPALSAAPELERWAGLRPDTPDHLPVLGQLGEHSWVAAGHFRNGVLLAPATAAAVAALLRGDVPPVSIGIFDPARFGADNSASVRTSAPQSAQNRDNGISHRL